MGIKQLYNDNLRKLPNEYGDVSVMDADDAVTRRYVASRFQALSDEVKDKKSKLDDFKTSLEL